MLLPNVNKLNILVKCYPFIDSSMHKGSFSAFIFFLIHILQEHLNKLECCGKFIYFSNSTQIVKLNAHRLKYFKSLVLLIVMILAHI